MSRPRQPKRIPADTASEADKRRRRAASARLTALAIEYDRLRRALWSAAGPSFRDRVLAEAPEAAADDAAFLAAAREADTGFRLTRGRPDIARELAAAKRARDALVLAATGLVNVSASRSAGSWDDLRQAGSVELCVAADRFDPDRGCAFATFATPHIFGGTRPEVHSAVRLTRHGLRVWRQAERVRAKHAAETGESLSWAEVCDRLSWRPERVRLLEGVDAALALPCSSDDAPPAADLTLDDPLA